MDVLKFKHAYGDTVLLPSCRVSSRPYPWLSARGGSHTLKWPTKWMSLFRSETGLFNDISCPLGKRCSLGNCMFRHSAVRPSSEAAVSSTHVASKRPDNAESRTPVKKVKPNNDTTVKKVSKEDYSISLVPEIIDSPPVQHRQRVQFVHVIRDKLVENGYANANSRAIEIESTVAKRCTQFTYPMGIRSAVREITARLLDNEHEQEKQKKQTEEKTYCEELVNLLIPLRELEKRRYVVSIPEDSSPLESTHIVNCARCSTKFPIYSPATKTASCRFHLLKRQWDPAIKRLSPIFPCCGETLDESSGCEVRDFHVYKLEAPSEMQAVIPFREAPIPQSESDNGEFAVGLDCEMAWTTKGFELIRVTVVGYISRKTIFDRLVWPIGKILDLNTRFSGVSDMNDGIEFEGQKLLPVSLDELYKDLFKLITAKTIIIGHGLENDLNVLRLVHHRIVDTAILYPRIRHRTHSLKELAWDYLSRTIQTGEHDSMEDSLAAIDVVRQDIKNRCFKQRVQSFK